MSIKRGGPKYFMAGLVSMAAFLVYLRTLQNGFAHWDDNAYVYENPHIHAFNAAFLKWAFPSFCYANWHSFIRISHVIDCAILDLNPWEHLLSGIHSINSFIAVVLGGLYVNRGNAYFAMAGKRLAVADFQEACKLGEEEGCDALRIMGSNRKGK